MGANELQDPEGNRLTVTPDDLMHLIVDPRTEDWDVVTLWAEPPKADWETEGTEDPLVAVFWEVDPAGNRTGAVAGIEIIGFKGFDRWENIPDLPGLWRLDGKEPLPLKEVLKEVQRSLKQ